MEVHQPKTMFKSMLTKLLVKGDVTTTSAAEILQLERSIKEPDNVGAFKLGFRYPFLRFDLCSQSIRRLLLRREGDILIAVLKNGVSRRMSGFTG